MNRLVILFWSLVIVSTCVSAVRIFNKNETKNWAVLVAGSNGWLYYRHQADISHAHQLLTKQGIPKENIITFMYDDIAQNVRNPNPGHIYTDYDYNDVYEGVVIDYKGDDVTPDMFTRAMRGDAELKAAGKKVLESGPEDNVFVYFSDIGADGLIVFPDDELYASSLNDTITFMHENDRYGQMVFYIDSGSMFDGILSSRIKVYATTGSAPDERSYAAFCKDRYGCPCLAGEYSHNWMQDTENHHINEWSLDEQYENVRASSSSNVHVKKYGDSSMGSDAVSQYQSHHHGDSATRMTRKNQIPAVDVHDSLTSYITSMEREIEYTRTEGKRLLAERRYNRASRLTDKVLDVFSDIAVYTQLESPVNPVPLSKAEEVECFESAFKVFRKRCFSIQQAPAVMLVVSSFHKLCLEGYSSDALIESIFSVCG